MGKKLTTEEKQLRAANKLIAKKEREAARVAAKHARQEAKVQARKAAIAAKKEAARKVDGEISGDEVERIRNALRQVWQWTSVARRNCIKRATDKDGFGHCENPDCKKVVAKLCVDHIEVMGSVFAPDYIQRLWCSSDKLQAICKKCHDVKTKQERLSANNIESDDFF